MLSHEQQQAAFLAALAKRSSTVDVFASSEIILPPVNAMRIYFHEGRFLVVDSNGNDLANIGVGSGYIDGGTFPPSEEDTSIDGGQL